ncbi:hypothetical protein Q8A67_017992 [Cirrhinus molitorella]|uniref:SplA/ryanodine receptor domain and SOCS box containing 4 n=1 Tax=Cirrhinus molitorella TaxID=172907 RepID=A0AA88TIJ9_9TELE|nr:hypothetical protein Q8A67_017992 [Cirrhinus molitorella]
MVKTEFVEVEIDDMCDPETSLMNHDTETEEQTDRMEVKDQKRELNEKQERSPRDSRERVGGLIHQLCLCESSFRPAVIRKCCQLRSGLFLAHGTLSPPLIVRSPVRPAHEVTPAVVVDARVWAVMGQRVSAVVKSADEADSGELAYPPVCASLRNRGVPSPARLELLLDMPPAAPEIQLRHAWNPDDRSLNLFIKDDDRLTFHRHPVAQSTDCVRGKVGFTRGLHAWTLRWPVRQRGTHAVVGVATSSAPLRAVGYSALVGSDAESWGWDMGRGRLYHDRKTRTGPAPPYPEFIEDEEDEGTFSVPEEILVVLDMDEGTLGFCADGNYLGVAFRGLKGKRLYPIVSAVWGHCEVTMTYVNGLDPEPLPLMELCRRAARQALGRHRIHHIQSLPLPQTLKNYLQYQ